MGNSHPDPEYRYLNEGPSSTVSPNKLDLRPRPNCPLAPAGVSHRRYCRRHPRRMAAQRVFHGVLRFSYDNHRQRRVVERAGQPAARRRSEGFQRVGGRRAGQPVVRYDIVRARHGGAVWNIQSQRISRARICQSRCQFLPDVSHLTDVSAQFRLEALNVTNTTHWANPGTNVSAIDFGQVTFTANPGREYDERNLRIGVRLTF